MTMNKINNKIIEEIKDIIAQKISPIKILLFGSFAKGEEKEESNLDLLIIRESSLPRHKRAKQIRLLLSKYIFGKDVLLYTPDEIEEWKDVPDAFITTVTKEDITRPVVIPDWKDVPVFIVKNNFFYVR